MILVVFLKPCVVSLMHKKIHHIYVFGKDMNFMSLWLGILYTSSSPIWTYRVKIILCIILIIGDTNIPYIFVLFFCIQVILFWGYIPESDYDVEM